MKIAGFESLSSLDGCGIDEVLASNHSGDFGISSENIINYRRSLIDSIMEQKNRISGFVALKDNSCQGFILISFSEWDSETLGLPVAKILWFEILPHASAETGIQLLETALGMAREWSVECVISRVNFKQPSLMHLLEDHSFRLMDVSITLGLASSDITRDIVPPKDGMIRSATLNDLPTLKEIASSNFRYSHFHMDPKFPGNRTSNLFSCWIESAVKGRASEVLVLETGEKISGFVTLNLDPRSGQTMGFELGELDLLAVTAQNQGKGYGKLLVQAGLEWLKPRVRFVEVRTQLINSPAISTLIRSQFQLLSSGISLISGATFHGWLKG